MRCTLAAVLLAVLLGAAVAAPPPGRTAIKINADRNQASSSTPPQPNAGRGTPTSAYTGRYTPPSTLPALFRQPNAVALPPHLQPPVEQPSAEQGANGEPVLASLYDRSEGEAIEGFIAGSQPGGAGEKEEHSLSGGVLAGATSSKAAADDATLAASDAAIPASRADPPRWSALVSDWSALAGQCWSYRATSYEYSFCPFANVTQRSTAHSLHVVLGVWDQWVLSAAVDASTHASGAALPAAPASLQMHFTDGTACGSGKRRSTHVLFLCAEEEQESLSDVSEPHTCEYVLRFHTALLCDPDRAAAAKRPLSAAQQTIANMQQCITALWAQTDEESSAARAALACHDFIPTTAAAAVVSTNDADTPQTLLDEPTHASPPPVAAAAVPEAAVVLDASSSPHAADVPDTRDEH